MQSCWFQLESQCLSHLIWFNHVLHCESSDYKLLPIPLIITAFHQWHLLRLELLVNSGYAAHFIAHSFVYIKALPIWEAQHLCFSLHQIHYPCQKCSLPGLRKQITLQNWPHKLHGLSLVSCALRSVEPCMHFGYNRIVILHHCIPCGAY